jgi:hypothetical protein
VKRLRELHAKLAAYAGATPSKMSFRRVKRAHNLARRMGILPGPVRAVDVAPAERM